MNSVNTLLNKFAHKAMAIGENARIERALNGRLLSCPIQHHAISTLSKVRILSTRGFLHYYGRRYYLAEKRYTHV